MRLFPVERASVVLFCDEIDCFIGLVVLAATVAALHPLDVNLFQLMPLLLVAVMIIVIFCRTALRSSRDGENGRIEEAVLHSVREAVFRVRRNRKYSKTNPAATRIFGYEADEFLGKKISMIVPFVGTMERTAHPQGIIDERPEVQGLRKKRPAHGFGTGNHGSAPGRAALLHRHHSSSDGSGVGESPGNRLCGRFFWI
jgi:PAS domain-containing protein